VDATSTGRDGSVVTLVGSWVEGFGKEGEDMREGVTVVGAVKKDPSSNVSRKSLCNE